MARAQDGGLAEAVSAHEAGGTASVKGRFIHLAENASDIIFRYRFKPTRGFEYVNAALTAITGYTPEEAYACPEAGRNIVHPDDRALLENCEHNPAACAQPLTFRMIGKYGQVIWVERRVIPIVDENKEIVAIEGIVRDITRHVLTEQTLERLVEERTREIERRRQVAESLREALAVLNSDRSTPEVLEYIVDRAIPLLGAGAAAIYRLDADTQMLRIQSSKGLEADYVARMEIPIGQGPVGTAVLERRPVPAPDVASALVGLADRLGAPKHALLMRLVTQYHALLAIPLIAKNEIYGGLVAYYPEVREFTEEDIALARALGDQIALTIENARLRIHLREAAAIAERERLARDLHDSVTQTLFSVNLIAGVLPRLWERDQEEAREQLAELHDLARGALAEMRTLLLELRPAALAEARFEDLLRQLAEAAMGRGRLSVSVATEGEGLLPTDLRVALYRITQEALNNVIKHAKATRCEVAVRWGVDEVRLTIDDNGAGFDPHIVSQVHFGLGIMKERAEAVGASLAIRSQPGSGTVVEVTRQAAVAAVT